MSTDRDTHFSGYAKDLFQEMKPDLTALCVALGSRKEQDLASTEQIIQQLLARRIYDLAMHVIGSLNSYLYDVSVNDTELINHVDDMPKLPKMEE